MRLLSYMGFKDKMLGNDEEREEEETIEMEDVTVEDVSDGLKESDTDYETIMVEDLIGDIKRLTISEDKGEDEDDEGAWIRCIKDDEGLSINLYIWGINGSERYYELVRYDSNPSVEEFVEEAVENVETIFEAYRNDNLPEQP